MKIIQKICDNISDEIEYAEDYAKDALYYRENWPQIAEIYYKIANFLSFMAFERIDYLKIGKLIFI